MIVFTVERSDDWSASTSSPTGNCMFQYLIDENIVVSSNSNNNITIIVVIIEITIKVSIWSIQLLGRFISVYSTIPVLFHASGILS